MRILPTICVHRCTVVRVSVHASAGSAGHTASSVVGLGLICSHRDRSSTVTAIGDLRRYHRGVEKSGAGRIVQGRALWALGLCAAFIASCGVVLVILGGGSSPLSASPAPRAAVVAQQAPPRAPAPRPPS